MKSIKVLKGMTLIFAALTIFGAIYVISTGGEASPGFAVVPMVFSLALSSTVRSSKK